MASLNSMGTTAASGQQLNNNHGSALGSTALVASTLGQTSTGVNSLGQSNQGISPRTTPNVNNTLGDCLEYGDKNAATSWKSYHQSFHVL